MAITVKQSFGSSGAVPGLPIEELATPVVLVDLDRMERNMAEFPKRITRHGVKFRPHIKTSKVPEIGLRMAAAANAPGIACAKVSEAEVFEAAGARDIVIAYPVVGVEKWDRIADLATRARMTVNFDSVEAAHGVAAAALARGVTVGLQMEIDTGFHRCGVPVADLDAAARLAEFAVQRPGVEFEGITTHRQIFYEGATDIPTAGHDEGVLMVELADRLRAKGIPVQEVTGGGTIVGAPFAAVPGVTEARAGTYVFLDLMNVGLGNCSYDDIALSVMTTVVSRWAHDAGTVDGGTKTFSGDRGVAGKSAGVPQMVELKGMAESVDRDIWLERMTEEHGMFRMGKGVDVRVGEKVRFYPYHVCTCVNLSDELVGVRDGFVEKVWKVEARGKRT